jgi:inhibitor of cysteine peptidase
MNNIVKFVSILIISLLVVGILTVIALAPWASDNNELNVTTCSGPFSLNGDAFELSGYSEGLIPNRTYDFNLSVRNDTDDAWKGTCYIFLVDKDGPFLDVSNFEFDLLPKGGQNSTVVKLTLPADMNPGAYGLALVIPGIENAIQTIYVGNNITNDSIGAWPDISSYRQVRCERDYEDLAADGSSKWIASAHVGDTIIVTLASNPTTGFKWSDTPEMQNPGILKQLDHKYLEPEQNGNVGAFGKEVWIFQTLKAGTTEISMNYSQPWEGGEKEKWTFVATIQVE